MSEESIGPNIRERLWIEKFDHDEDPPRLIESVFVENGVIVERRTHHAKEAEAGTAGSVEAPDVQGESRYKKLNLRALGAIAVAANDAGIGLSKAMVFLAKLQESQRAGKL